MCRRRFKVDFLNKPIFNYDVEKTYSLDHFLSSKLLVFQVVVFLLVVYCKDKTRVCYESFSSNVTLVLVLAGKKIRVITNKSCRTFCAVKFNNTARYRNTNVNNIKNP